MKRSVGKILTFTIAIATLAIGLNSCSKRNIDPGEPIRLGPSSIINTKAAIDSLPVLIAQSYNDGINKRGLGVYGYKTVTNTGTNQTTATKVFNNTEVTHTTGTISGGEWTYRYKRYWDSNPNAKYQFFAYWPRIISDSEPSFEPGTTEPYVTESGKIATLCNIPNWQYGDAADDYMTATSFGVYNKEGGYKYNNGRVAFRFSHLLSQLIIKGYYIGSREDTITVTGFELKESQEDAMDVLTSSATDFSLDFSEYGYAITMSDNSSDYGRSNIILQNAEIGISKASYTEDGSSARFDTALVAKWFMVPHPWNSIQLCVSYKIGIDGMEKTSEPIVVNWVNDPTDFEFAAGSKYTLTLKFNSAGQGVTIESVYVSDWIDSKVDPMGVYNW